MLDSIHVGTSGLLGHAQGLRVIANNTANLNTPGYKGASAQFTELLDASGARPAGGGVVLVGTRTDFRQGELRQTGQDADLALQGDGWFVLRDAQGQQRYTRSGAFSFDAAGRLVAADGAAVQGRDSAGRVAGISLAGLATVGATPTTTLRFSGNLSSTVPSLTVGNLAVVDSQGAEHALSLRLTPVADAAGSWKAELLDGTSSVGEAQLKFIDGRPDPAASRLAYTYMPAGGAAQPIVLEFGGDVSSFASGSLSSLAMASHDGRPPGALSRATFDAAGVLTLAYSNGRTVQGQQLLLARLRTPQALQPAGEGRYAAGPGVPVDTGVAGAGAFGTVRGGALELSNVDLSREFSDLVVLQRGYQAASQVVATANDMLQELFNMKSK